MITRTGSAADTAKFVNGLNVTRLEELGKELTVQPELARFRFLVRNAWSGEGGYSTSAVLPHHGLGQEWPHRRVFQLVADEPEALLGQDRGANPLEQLLGALASCLTGALVYHAAARGIELRKVESKLEGVLDVRGVLGIAPEVRKGFQRIQVEFQVDTDATPQELRELVEFSPVLDSLRNGVPIGVKLRCTPRA